MRNTVDDLRGDSGRILPTEDAMNDAQVLSTSAIDRDAAPGFPGGAIARERPSPRNGRARQRRHHRRRWMASIACRNITGDERQLRQDRISRLRLLAWLVLGATCLLVVYQLAPETVSLFVMPSSWTGRAFLVCGIVGFWLTPGLWMSAVLMRTGAGLTAWLGTRIGTTLAWYALVGPMIHQLGLGAQVTTKGILIATLGATAAVSLGLLLGMSRRPAQLWLRLLVPALLGGVCAQIVISVLMRVWTYDMNYTHIRRLDWLIVTSCAVLVSVATLSRPKLPPVPTIRHIRTICACLAILLVTVAALMATNSKWSPGQQMPSAFGVEQVSAPAGADIAFSLTAIGPEGPALIRQADFTAFDEAGRQVPVHLQLVNTDGTAEQAMLLVVLQPGSQPVLCRPGRAAKLTIEDRVTGVRVQAVIPQGWCTG